MERQRGTFPMGTPVPLCGGWTTSARVLVTHHASIRLVYGPWMNKTSKYRLRVLGDKVPGVTDT